VTGEHLEADIQNLASSIGCRHSGPGDHPV